MKSKSVVLLFVTCLMPFITLHAQDECSNAVNIPVEQYSTCGEMALESVDIGAATPSTTSPVPSCASFSSGSTNDLWYTFTVPPGINTMAFHAFNTDALGLTDQSAPGMAVYSGTNCSNLDLLECFESDGGFMQNGEIRWEQISGLTPGETIYIRVWDENNLDQQFFIAASVRLDMDEDECESAVELTTGGCNILSSPGPVQAPEECGWTSSDNTIFYHFTVTDEDDQPYTIEAENGECVSNEGPTNPEIQLAVWSWDGSSCDDVGGSPSSDPANNTGSYYGCANGTGTVVFSENLPPGEYILAMDGYSGLSGTSLCTFGFAAPFIDPELNVTLNTNNASCGFGGSASINVNYSCSGTPDVDWSTGASSMSVDNLDPGDYSVTVTDEAPCGDTVIDFTITDEGSISVDATATGDICNGPFEATAEVDGADPGDCTFEWSTDPTQTTQTATNLDPGTYTVTVTYGTCEETASVDVDYSNLDIEVNYDTPVCEGDDATATVEVLNGTAPYSYDWSTGETGSSISLDESDSYSVTVTDANDCTEEESFNITIYPTITVENFSDTVCDEGDYIVSFDVIDSNSDPADFIVNGTSYSGSYSETFPSGNNYDLEVYDENGCSEFHFVGSHDCSCSTNAGSMVDVVPLNLCTDECTPTDLHNDDATLDGDDVLEFVLHDGESPINNILATNNNTEFCFDDISGLSPGTTYYISAIAGNDDGNGHVDQSDPCFSVAQGKPVVWNQIPIVHTVHDEISVCGLEAEVIANSPASGATGTWSSSASFSPVAGSTVHDTAMTVLVSDYDDITFNWTVNNNGCTNSDNVLVHFNQTPTAYAGDDNTVCGLLDTLHAVPSISGSEGYWTGSQISFESSGDPETPVTANNYGTYTMTWTEDNGGCNDHDQVEITFIQEPQPTISTDVDTTCGQTYELNVTNVTGDGSWSATTLGGNTINPTFNPVDSPNTTAIIPNYDGLSQTVIFYWTESTQEQGVVCTEQAQTQITFSKEPYAYVGNNDEPEVCGNQYTFDADTVGSGYADGTWICETTTVNWNGEQNLPDATATIPPGAFGDTAHVTIPFIWRLTNIGCSDMDTAFVTFYKQPDANAGNDDEICGLSYDLEAFYNLPQNGDYEPYGFWYEHPDNLGSANFVNEDTATTTVNVNQPGEYQFIWRENNSLRSNCNDRDTITITFKEKPVISAGDDFDVCGKTTNMSAVSAGFDGNWLSEPGIIYDDPNDPNTGVSYGTYGSVDLVWQESNDECTSMDEVTVTFWRKPTAELAMDTEDTTECGRLFNLRAENPGSGVNGNWVADPSNSVDFYHQEYNDTVEVTYYGHYDFYWTESNHPDNEPPTFCSDTSEPWTVHFIEIPEANAGIDTLFCGLEGDLTADFSVGTSTGEWANFSSNITFEDDTVPNTVVYSDVYTEGNPNYDAFLLEWTEDNYGCTDTDEILVRFARVPSADVTIIPPRCFGEPASIKANEDYHPEYNWELHGGIVDSTWDPVSDTSGNYRRLIHWVPEDADDTVHQISLQVVSRFDCASAFNDTVVFEPGVPGYEMEIFPDSCLLGKGGATFIPDSSMTGFRWIDTDGLDIDDPTDTIQRNIPAGTYHISQVYPTLNQDHVTFYQEVFGDEICRDTFAITIDTVGMITADFEVAADIDLAELVAPEATVWFNNLSDGDELRTSNVWYFDDGESETNNDEQVEHIYTEPNDCYEPYLVVYARNLPECRDTAFMDCIKVDDRSNLEVPNIFTPNGDGINDFFQVKAQTLRSFNGKVVNRWGRTIYEWDNYEDEEDGWNGKLSGGNYASPGVYFYIIKAEGIDGYVYDLQGPLHLIRTK